MLHPAKLAWGLKRACVELGVRVYENTPALTLKPYGAAMAVRTPYGSVRARRVALGTNIFPNLVRRVRPYTVPVYDYALMTEPLTAEQLASVGWKNRQGLGDSANQFHYFRLSADNRILWGGYDAVYPYGGRVRAELAQHCVVTLEPVAAAATATSIPAEFDTDGFERIAKMIFIRMQTANDAGDLDDLRAFTTPEMFASVRSDLHKRGDVVNRTDVVQVDAQVLDVATESGKQVVSVRFHGLIREVVDGTADRFDEVWHLVKPLDGSREWAIAGIQQTA